MEGRRSRCYCSSACQQAATRWRLIAGWLATWIARAESKKDHYVRTYVLEEQGSLCAVCRMPGKWQGEPLVFVLDHVNGNPDDNRCENLRLLCPNCDSQAPTFKSRNRGRGRAWRRQRYAEGLSF
jgi:5-methylcytosine-specific restriction endonuclease McrA